MTRRKVCLWFVQTGLFIFSPQSFFFFFCLQLANPVVQNPWTQQTGCTVEGILFLRILIEVLCYTSSPLYIMTCFGKRQKRSCNSLLSNLFLAKRVCWTEYGLHKFQNHLSLIRFQPRTWNRIWNGPCGKGSGVPLTEQSLGWCRVSLAMPISVGLVFLPCDELKCVAGMLER